MPTCACRARKLQASPSANRCSRASCRMDAACVRRNVTAIAPGTRRSEALTPGCSVFCGGSGRAAGDRFLRCGGGKSGPARHLLPATLEIQQVARSGQCGSDLVASPSASPRRIERRSNAYAVGAGRAESGDERFHHALFLGEPAVLDGRFQTSRTRRSLPDDSVGRLEFILDAANDVPDRCNARLDHHHSLHPSAESTHFPKRLVAVGGSHLVRELAAFGEARLSYCLPKGSVESRSYLADTP